MNKKIFLPFVLAITYFNSFLNVLAIDTWPGKIDPGLIWPKDDASIAVQRIIANVIGFLYILAVIYWLWWGFTILTAGWADDKVKKGKTILIQAILWLVVIWLASSIVQWVVTKILV